MIDILLPDLRGGGAERVCLNLANEFASRGLPGRMVVMRAEGEVLPLLEPRVRCGGSWFRVWSWWCWGGLGQAMRCGPWCGTCGRHGLRRCWPICGR